MQTTARTFRDIQQEYDQLFTREPIRDEARGYRSHAWVLLKELPSRPQARVLDVACGGGYFFKELLGLAEGRLARPVGIDLSGRALQIASKECPTALYLLSAGESLPFKEKTFDAVTCLGSLEHFLDIPSAVAEMKRVLRPGGIFFILVPNLFWYKDILSVLWSGDKLTRNQTHERFACLGEWKRTLQECGLTVRRTYKYNGIARKAWKQRLKDFLIPVRFSYHFLFICTA